MNIADELAGLCLRLSPVSEERGGEYLALKFGVDPWSTQFFQILTAIMARFEELRGLVDRVQTMRPAIRESAREHIDEITSAFARDGLSKPWSSYGASKMVKAHSDAILHLSPGLSAFDYQKPDRSDVDAILKDANELLEWLEEHQLEEHDFIRACLIVGVKEFLFRLEKLEWVGWSYTADSLREVMGAYFTLDRGIDSQSHQMVVATMKKIMGKLAVPIKLLSGAREIKDDAEFALALYKGVASVHFGGTIVAGLLPG